MKAANFYTCIVPNLEGRMKNLWNNTQTERDIKYQQTRTNKQTRKKDEA